MAQDWEAKFSKWTEPPSDAEQRRYEWTRDAIREALRDDGGLSDYSFNVYAKGSYPNFTNVVADSDVDVAVELTTYYDPEFYGRAKGLTLEDVGGTPYRGDHNLGDFKDDVHRVLLAQFGSSAVERGNKAIHIRESRRGLAADVVPCVTHRAFYSPGAYHDGIQLRNDAKPLQQIDNYPRQHLDRGVAKNNECSKRYKRVVRILKRLENEMVDREVIGVVPSFLIESAVWNVPKDHFGYATWRARVRATLAYIFNETMGSDCVSSSDWMEANGIKYLFHSSQNWTYQQAHEFASEAWDYIGFE